MIKLKANNKIFETWLTAKVTRSLNAVSGCFEISFVTNFDTDLKSIALKPGDECELCYDDQILITGFIDQIDNSCSADSFKFQVKGRDRTGDLVDSANIYNARVFKSVSLNSMAETLAKPFNVSVSSLSSRGTEQIKNVSVQQNETVWETISRVAKYQGVLAYPDKKGGIIFADVSTDIIATLKQGDEILELSYTQNDSQKFQTYRIYITQGDAETKHKRTVANATDNSVKRPRLKQIATNKSITLQEAKERAKWEMAKQIAKSFNLNISLCSWTITNTTNLWEINKLVTVDFPKFGINGTFLIEETSFDFSENGYKTDLKLVLKDAYNPVEDRKGAEIGDAGEV